MYATGLRDIIKVTREVMYSIGFLVSLRPLPPHKGVDEAEKARMRDARERYMSKDYIPRATSILAVDLLSRRPRVKAYDNINLFIKEASKKRGIKASISALMDIKPIRNGVRLYQGYGTYPYHGDLPKIDWPSYTLEEALNSIGGYPIVRHLYRLYRGKDVIGDYPIYWLLRKIESSLLNTEILNTSLSRLTDTAINNAINKTTRLHVIRLNKLMIKI